MIDSILAAIAHALESHGEWESPEGLASQLAGLRLWRASKHDVRAALDEPLKLLSGS